MFCPNCGTQNDDNGVKCQKCGFNLKGAAAPKFKGTMLMMNSPVAAAPRAAPPAGAGPVPAPWPKSMAKATMIGVAPPSPGAVAPPAPLPSKPPVTQTTSNAPKLSGPPTGPAPIVSRPIPPPAQPGNPVNPFGGTMLMGSYSAPAEAPTTGDSKAAESSEQSAADRTVTSEGAPPPNAAVAPSLDTTTPSVSPAPPGIPHVPTQNEMAAFGASDTAPAPADTGAAAPAAAFPKVDWGSEAVGAAAAPVGPSAITAAAIGSPTQGPVGKVRPIGMVVALGIVTLGIYWLIALFGALQDFRAYRQKSDINPIFLFIPILGLLEIIKLPPKVTESRVTAGVANPVEPNLVLYILFPQIFFIADLNEILQAAANRRSMTAAV